MKSLNNYITEAYYSANSPDSIRFKSKYGGFDELTWGDWYGVGFIYSTRLNQFLIGDRGEPHSNIVYDSHSKGELIKFDNLYEIISKKDGLYSLRFGDDEENDYADYDDWKSHNKEINNRFKLGRYWLYDGVLYMTWWDQLTAAEFDKYNKELLKFVTKEVEDYGEEEDQFDEVYYMTNSGRLIKYDPNKKSKTRKSTKRKEILKIQQAIHLANQKDKNEFFKEFKRNRDANNQKIYNHTKSKTEAEWRSIRYQDSLIDTEKNKIID